MEGVRERVSQVVKLYAMVRNHVVKTKQLGLAGMIKTG